MNGVVDTAAINAFCSGTLGFLVTWYDQSTNGNNLAASTAALQPTIYNAGIITLNGLTSTSYGGTSRIINATAAQSQPFTYFVTARATADGSCILDSFNSNRTILYRGRAGDNPGKFVISSSNVAASLTQNSDSNFNNFYALYNGASSEFAVNNGALASGDIGTNAISGYSMGNLRGNPNPLVPYPLVGNVSEAIVWGNNQAANRAAIQANINAYYSIW